MRPMPVWLIFTCRLILIVLLPVVLVLTNVRLLMTHAFPEVEYSLPGFPDDVYGMSKADRLKYSKLSIDYLLNNQSIAWLRALRFDPGVVTPPESCPAYLDGDCNRFYNDRELQHMLDVKNVTTAALRIWAVAGILCLLAVAALYGFGQRAALRGALLSGSGLTVALLLVVVFFVIASFGSFFTQFHEVLFADGTWTFLWSDSLIRLFPLRFWQDTFLFVGGGAIVEALAVAGVAWYGLK
jgi:integral membrane protein (TIGR01906 family)